MVFRLTSEGLEINDDIVHSNISANSNSNVNSGFSLQTNDSETIFDGSASYLFYPNTGGTSSSFTNNSTLIQSVQNGRWGSHTYITTTNTPDGSNSMILRSQSYGYAGIDYPLGNSHTTTISYWVKFDNDSDHPTMTAMSSAGWGGAMFTIGNSNTTGRQIMIQFEQNTGYLRVFVIGVTSAINTVSYQSTKYNAGTWLLMSLSIENTNVKVYINGILQFSFEIEQLLIDAYNQLNGTSVTTLSSTSFSSYLNDYTKIIMILRDIQPTYFSFDLWKIYFFDRILTDNEHLVFYQSTSGQNTLSTSNIDEINIDSKKFLIHITFSTNNTLPNYNETPYIIKVNNTNINKYDQILINVQTNNPSIVASAYSIEEGYFNISIFNYDIQNPFSDTLTLNVYNLT